MLFNREDTSHIYCRMSDESSDSENELSAAVTSYHRRNSTAEVELEEPHLDEAEILSPGSLFDMSSCSSTFSHALAGEVQGSFSRAPTFDVDG